MELIYSTRKSNGTRREWTPDDTPICALSCQNVIAFSTTVQHHFDPQKQQAARTSKRISSLTADVLSLPFSVTGVASKQSPDPHCPVQVNYYIYVCDIDKPWAVYLVASYQERVVALDWHLSGHSLLVATVTGKCQVWETKDYMINCWSLNREASLAGEEILVARWLHYGNRVVLKGDKRDATLYSEKMNRVPFKPCLSHYGGQPTDSWVALTATGMVSIGMAQAQSKEVTMKSECLGISRSRLQVADVSFDSSGAVMVAVSDGSIASAVRCYKVSLTADKSACLINCEPMAGFYVKGYMEKLLRESTTSRITNLQFVSRESGDKLIVAVGDTNISHVELWTLQNTPIVLHGRFGSPMMGEVRSTRWAFQSEVIHTSIPISIGTPRFPVVYGESFNHMFQYIAIAYKDGSIKLVNQANFQPIATTNLDLGISDGELSEPPGKRQRVIAHMMCMMQTFTGCSLVGLDQYSCLYVMKTVNTRDPVTQVPPAYMVAMLEYSLLFKYDWWDILAALKPGMLETVVQRLSDHFSQQPMATRELLYSRFMALKSWLLRSSQVGQQRAADCHSRLLLHSVATLLKALLRPKVMGAQDMSPAEKLTTVCNQNTDTDVDKVLKMLCPEKEFAADPPSLQALQQLLQWVADLALYLVSIVPVVQGYNSLPGGQLVRDRAVLATLRELLVLTRLWGIISSHCLPHFTTITASFDSLAHLFKLLTRLWLSCKESGELEEGLIDDCGLLSNEILLPPLDQGLFGSMNYCSSVLVQSHPQTYFFNETPSHATEESLPVLPSTHVLSQQKKDIVRQIYLGVNPIGEIRICCRCGCSSMLKGISKLPAIRAWDLRWTKNCICGGLWKLSKPNEA